MDGFARACLYYFLCGFDRGFHSWLLLFSRHIFAGIIAKDDDCRRRLSEANIAGMFGIQLEPDAVIRMLIGDAYFDRNKRDIAKLEKIMGRSVFDLWDTDPIFNSFPHLRGLARNAEFEKMWEKNKQKIK